MPTKLSMSGKKLRIKELMSQKGTTNVQLAKHLGMSPVSISYIVNGQTLPSLQKLADIANFFNVTMGELFDDYKEIDSPALTCPHCGKEINITLS